MLLFQIMLNTFVCNFGLLGLYFYSTSNNEKGKPKFTIRSNSKFELPLGFFTPPCKKKLQKKSICQEYQ